MCCANGVMIKIGHVMDDVVHNHAHTLFTWSLMRVGINDCITFHNSMANEHHLPPSHGDDVQASRTTLFEGGGDDVAQPTSITMTSQPTHAKSPELLPL